MSERRYSNKGLRILLVVSVCGLFSCAPPHKADVIERSTIDRNIDIERIGGSLVRHVQPGDTLYSIAFAMNLDPNEVAAWNKIDDTSKLTVGQRIRLTQPSGFIANTSINATVLEDEQIIVVPIEGSNSQPSPAIESSPGRQTQTSPSSNQTTISPNQTTVANVQEPKVPVQNVQPLSDWSWPLNGKVIRSFSQAQGQQGIDIQGQTGQAVYATNGGEVVYVGNSLRGYGNLVIIKHNDIFLSAYAHNSEIFVREGKQVAAKQRIATIGTNRAKQTALHFQIRKNGQPVNPLSYLSKSG